MAEEKVRENLVRRKAQRQGLQLQRSRSRDPRAVDYATYQLVDPATNTLVSWGLQSGYGLTLDDVERLLDDGAEEAAETGKAPKNFIAVTKLMERADIGSERWTADFLRLAGDWTAADLEVAATWHRKRAERMAEEAERHRLALEIINAYGVKTLGQVPGWSEAAYVGDKWRQYAEGLLAKAPK